VIDPPARKVQTELKTHMAKDRQVVQLDELRGGRVLFVDSIQGLSELMVRCVRISDSAERRWVVLGEVYV
jgi:hypothetical protein